MKNTFTPKGCIRTKYLLAFVFIIGFRFHANAQTINTVAGNGMQAYNGDGVLATSAALNLPQGVAVDKLGNIYIADTWNNRVRKVDITTGLISTYAGGGSLIADNVPATQTQIYQPIGIAVDDSANVFVTDGYYNRVREISNATGLIKTVAGNGNTNPGYLGDGGPALQAEFFSPFGIALDDTGNIYITDEANNRVRKVEKATGIINTIAGNGVRGYTGDGHAADSAEVGFPTGVAVDKAGNIYIAQFMNNIIRKVNASTGIITTIGGNGTAGFAGNGGLAVNAEFNNPAYIALDDSDNIYVGDLFNAVVRKITASTGIVTTLAGDTTTGFAGDGGPATSAEMNEPSGVTVDACNNVYVAERGNNRVRKITVAHAALTTAFTASATTVCPGQQVTFTDTSNYNVTNWNWSFYGGTPATSTIKNPVITYDTPGPYSVLLTTNNGCGSASETAVQYITVGLQPTLSITPVAPATCQQQPLTIAASGATIYQWVGTSNATDSITVNPSADTTYQLHTSNGTCSRDTTIMVKVNSLPAIDVEPQSATYCFGTGAHFTATGGNTYIWSPSTGLTATTGSNVVATPASTTTYTITASSSAGCTATATDILTILPAPTIGYNYTGNGNTITFNTDSASGGVTTYSWNFGDSSAISNDINPTHTYTKTGNYYSCLTVYNNSNCSYTRCQYVDLTKTGVPNISGETDFQLYPNPVSNKLVVVSGELLAGSIEITNLLGQTLITQIPSINSKQTVIDISTLPSGVYLLGVKNNNGVGVRKFVKE